MVTDSASYSLECVRIDKGDATIVMMHGVIAPPKTLTPKDPRSAVWLRLRAALAFLTLLAGTSATGAEEADETPPDPLAAPALPAPSQRGYIGGGDVPPSLLAPSRLRLGDFGLSARASFGVLYDDNVDAADDERDDDVFLTFSPSVRAQSTYARHSLGVGASASTGTALKNTGDDFFDWQVGADGQLDLSRKSKVKAAVGYSRDVEDDEDIDAEDEDDDTPIHNIDASLSYDVDGERVGLGVGATISRLDVEGDDFEDRDRTSYGLNGRIRYRWSEYLTFSGGPSYRYSTFDEDVADDGDGRDAEQVDFQLGAGYRASRTIRTRAAIGYSIVTFDDTDRDNDDSLTGSVGLTWAPVLGTTLDLDASRTLGLSIEDGEDSRTTTRGSATLAHQLKLGSRSALSSSLGLSIARFSDLDRTDKNLIAGLTYGYRLAEFAFFTASYRYSQRFSGEEDADYYRNLISIGLTLSY